MASEKPCPIFFLCFEVNWLAQVPEGVSVTDGTSDLGIGREHWGYNKYDYITMNTWTKHISKCRPIGAGSTWRQNWRGISILSSVPDQELPICCVICLQSGREFPNCYGVPTRPAQRGHSPRPRRRKGLLLCPGVREKARIARKNLCLLVVRPEQLHCGPPKAMIYQSVLRSKLAPMDRETAISELKKKLSLHPRKPRVKNAKGKFLKKKLGQYVLYRFKGIMVCFSWRCFYSFCWLSEFSFFNDCWIGCFLFRFCAAGRQYSGKFSVGRAWDRLEPAISGATGVRWPLPTPRSLTGNTRKCGHKVRGKFNVAWQAQCILLFFVLLKVRTVEESKLYIYISLLHLFFMFLLGPCLSWGLVTLCIFAGVILLTPLWSFTPCSFQR